MQLSDLFVSHKQVDPVTFNRDEPTLPQPIYFNLDRARKATTDESETTEETTPEEKEDMHTWKVGGSDPSPEVKLDWSVPRAQQLTTPKFAGAPIGNTDREKYWMGKFANYGLSNYQQLALLAAMRTECGLKPGGAVNKYELNHKGNTKGGWAHAGEGAVGFTHWDTKKKYIDMFNADPRRKGAKLTNIESEYAKAGTRHIADLDDDDQMLMTYLYYKPLLDRTKNETDFRNIVAEFYLQKAGRGFVKTGTAYDRAVKTGERYQVTHAKQGHIKASKTNQFLKSLDYALNLAQQMGYSV